MNQVISLPFSKWSNHHLTIFVTIFDTIVGWFSPMFGCEQPPFFKVVKPSFFTIVVAEKFPSSRLVDHATVQWVFPCLQWSTAWMITWGPPWLREPIGAVVYHHLPLLQLQFGCIWLFKIAMESGPFDGENDDLPTKNGDLWLIHHFSDNLKLLMSLQPIAKGRVCGIASGVIAT